MTRSQQRLLSQLATSDNDIASGLGQCLEALRLIAALPRASPVFVKYASTTKAFGRDHLSRVPLRTALTLIKTSLGLPDPIRIATAIFYRDDGTVDTTTAPVCVDEDSWKELAPYVHTLHVEDDLAERPATAHSTFSALSAASAVGPATPGGGCGSRGIATSAPSVLNSNASAFVPASNGIAIKTSAGGEGGPSKLSLQSFRKSSFSPVSPQPTSPFAILDNAGGCI